MSRRPQLPLPLLPTFGWGGARPGAGAKPAGDVAGLPHRSREAVDPRSPVHATLRCLPHVWNLRTQRAYRAIAAALRAVRKRPGFRVCAFSVQGNHVHVMVEADGPTALGDGMRALASGLARRLNELMSRRGPVLEDRYHAHALSTPTEAARALRYVLGNHASHALRRGDPAPRDPVDPFCSMVPLAPDGAAPPVQAPRTWLLATALAAAKADLAAPGGARPATHAPPLRLALTPAVREPEAAWAA